MPADRTDPGRYYVNGECLGCGHALYMGSYCANVRCGLRDGEFVVANEHVKRLANRVVELLAELGQARLREMEARRAGTGG